MIGIQSKISHQFDQILRTLICLTQKKLCEGKHDKGVRKVVSYLYVFLQNVIWWGGGRGGVIT